MNRFSVHAHVLDGTALVVARGTLDLPKASLLRAILRDAIDSGPRRIVVDFADVPMIDAAIAGVLAAQLDHAARAGVPLVVTGAHGLVLEVLEVLDLAKALNLGDPTPPPPRPAQPCCAPAGARGPGVADRPDAVVGSPMMPNAAIGALLEEMAGHEPDDPQRRLLHARVVELALPATNYMAARYRGRGESDDDLRQVAAVGLLKAVEGYDPSRGHQFSDYAVPTILGELRRHFRDRGWAMHVPRRVKELLLDVRQVTDQLTQELNRAPSAQDVADVLGVSTSAVEQAMEAAQGYRPQSLSLSVDGGTTELGDLIGVLDPAYEYLENWQSISSVLHELPERTRKVLALRFRDDMSQTEIAEVVGVSQVHVSRILSQAFITLRAALMADE
jgi:RNA polymerase sigma-B factor